MKCFLKYFVLLGVVIACNDDEGSSLPLRDPHYLVLQTGAYQIYDVEQIEYFPEGDPDTSFYELRSQVVDSLLSGDNYVYFIQRSKRSDESEPWIGFDSWSVRIDNNEVVVNESNVLYLKMLWPAKPGTEWDGNKYNIRGEDQYEITSVDVPLEVNELDFDKTMTIVQEVNDDPIVFTDLRSETYARGVGLVAYDKTQLYYCVDASCNNQNVIVDGVVIKQRIKSYGIE